MATTGSPFASRRSAPDTTHLTCYLRQSVERRRINVIGFNCTTFLKALYIQQPDLTHFTVSLRGYGSRVLPKKKTRSMAGFVKMGDKRLRQQPPVILLMIGLTNKDRGPYRLIRRHDHRSDLFSRQLPRFLILNKSPFLGGRVCTVWTR